jgi:2-keto-4-pentenoate hydratase
MTVDETVPDADVREAAVAELFALAHGRLWADGVPPALASLADLSFEESLRLQLDVLAAWEADGESLGGWKIGLTSRAARDAMGPGVRPHGYVLASRILQPRTRLTAHVPNARLEPEIALVLGADLSGPDVTPHEARAAVESVAAAFEINSNRVPKASSLAVRLGNSLNNWGIVMGAPQDPASVDLGGLTVTIGNEHGEIESGHSSPETLDDPYLSLARVCHSLARNGRGLAAGQRLITGSLTSAAPLDGAHSYYADFGPLGRVSLEVG